MSAVSLSLASSEGAKASNLALALAALPADRRRDALTFYDFCRAVDDVVDDLGRTREDKEVTLRAWELALREPARSLPSRLSDMIVHRDLDVSLLVEIVRGMEMDIVPRTYASYADLQTYCWRAACAVGLVSAKIFGCRCTESQTYAEELGYALQLTNILRDVGEDARLGRVYLPLDDLAQFGVSEDSLRQGTPDGDFLGLMRFEATRARAHYAAAARSLHPDDRRALVAADIMRRTYEKLLARMEADGFQVFAKRYRLSKWEKLWLLVTGSIRNVFR